MNAAPRERERLRWLDIARVLCALMILGIHWLRACYKLRLFGAAGKPNLVMDYQGQSGGLELFHYVLIAGVHASLSTWLTNVIGLLGGFGWEAVSALILISGFSLALAQGSRSLEWSGWVAWFAKRAKRILVPYYLVALPLLALCGCAILILQHEPGRIPALIDAKLLSQFNTPLPGVIISHLFLFDPWEVQWGANFFAPAWWFVPAILLAYAAYPLVRRAGRIGRGVPLLVGTAAITLGSYALVNAGILINETWYYIVLQESFNFALGVVLADVWMGSGRAALERLITDPRVFIAALVIFAAGNVANWTPDLRPIASMLYGPSLVVIVAFLGKRLDENVLGRALLTTDPYDLYLVHQPFAFGTALLAKFAFHSYAVFLGWFVFVAIATGAARLLTLVQGRLVFRLRPAARKLVPSERVPISVSR